ncbi:MAG: hypothetical protein A2W91_09495 [Bacteroidetes bacterium GWF2_38_335]|nr:MAG: hypothetical protein A2W91_09495 [Bacteroidetes bacterium GWF2_38_335]OFY80799.1 MAG: hypothetical protein A2281_09005 [Bacteroidetes bacterium RIFOXYA12_FULL_38_20]HBS86198.1 peptidase [Bacteroidales bacterium]
MYKYSKFLIPIVLFIFWSCSSGENKTVETVEKDTLVVEIPDSLSITEKLKMLPGVELTEITCDSDRFIAGYKLLFSQPLDYNNPEKGIFKQKVYLSHKSEKDLMVMYLDGYSVNTNGYISELADILKSNHMHVEHRFFGESSPDSIDWSLLNIRNAAADHHRIVRLLKNIYKSKWISTGISKGGQTTMYHKRFYPQDVDVAVPIVAPLNLAMEDKRIYDFLDNVGTEECRKKVREMQTEIFKNYDKALELFKKKSMDYHYSYPMGYERAFELSVFEFEFAFWQWGGDCEDIPLKGKSLEDKINYVFMTDAPGFFTKTTAKDLFPFFWQAYTEVGMYGYRVEPFKDYLREYKSEVCNSETFIPAKFKAKFDPSVMKDIDSWLKKSGNNMIYVYGEFDAWSSTAFEPGKSTNALKIVKKGGSHTTRIGNLPYEQKKQVYDSLGNWLGIKLELENDSLQTIK